MAGVMAVRSEAGWSGDQYTPGRPQQGWVGGPEPTSWQAEALEAGRLDGRGDWEDDGWDEPEAMVRVKVSRRRGGQGAGERPV